jgi:transcriptional regulator with XRE-family HTH domain
MLEGRIRANIQALRAAADLSRPQLGALCDPKTSGQQIERIEKGQRRLTIEWIERIAKALRVEPEMLVGNEIHEFTVARPVAEEAAGAMIRVATGTQPDQVGTEIGALFLQALLETFVRYPEARGDPGAARPIVDFLTRQFSR